MFLKKEKKQEVHHRKKRSANKWFLFVTGILVGMIILLFFYQTSLYFSTDQSCMSCHVHPHAEDSWRLSSHANNSGGIKVHCVECHLPPAENTWEHFSAKMTLGMRDVWSYLTKDTADIDWEAKAQLEHAVKIIPNKSCIACHEGLFPNGISDEGIKAHLYYEEKEKVLNLQCISCHLDVGHYNPNYKHAALTGVPGLNATSKDTSLLYKKPAELNSFADFRETVPGTTVAFNMKAIPGGSFVMGSPDNEAFRNADEGPVRNITLSPFYMAEIEVSWDQFWAFYAETMSEGRTAPEMVYQNNRRPDVDAVSGPTPPFGFPDQGWGGGDRPAITMTHYAAEIYCLWLTKKTGKKYRLPTEAEWEYAARGGTQTPYFFPGNPKQFSNEGFWRKFIAADKHPIGEYIVYANNSNSRTQLPESVQPNPFGLKNMLGNVMEYCADKYIADAYSRFAGDLENPLVKGSRDDVEYVVRGGYYASDASAVRCAARDHTRHDDWLKTDPQQPKSIWWYSDVKGIGFRVVCDNN